MTEREFKVGDRVKIIGNSAGHRFNIGDTTVLEDTSPQREYETQALPDTDQVTYRWRKAAVKEPVVTTKVWTGHFDTRDNRFYISPPSDVDEYPCKITVTLTDGVPTSMVGEFL